MIERFQRIATSLNRIRLLILLIGIFAAAGFLLSLFDNQFVNGDVWLIPSLIALCWALTLYSLTVLFRNIPQKAAKGTAWHRRALIAIRRGVIWVLALLMLALSLGVLALSYELLRAWWP